jgi:pimeloyl-ACP methyl ester carboxylesterase
MDADLPTGVRLYHESEGTGDPIVLLHGTGCDNRFWKLQREAYAGTHRVITVDMRGSGRSDVPTDPTTYTSEVMADDVAALVTSLALEPVHLAGHSLGSCVAQQVAIRHPHLVRSLQLHATWAHADAWLQRAFIGTTRYPLELGDLHATFRTVMMWMLSPEYLTTRGPEQVAAMVRHCFIDNPHQQANQGMLGHLHADEAHDTRALLAQLRVPVLVTAGEQDYLIPARYGVEVAELIDHAELHLFNGPRSSHGVNWEIAAEFNDVTMAFMERA